MVGTAGNTETATLKGRLQLDYKDEPYRQSLRLETLRTESADQVTGRRDALQSKTEYQFSPRTYSFGLLSYQDDRFSGFDYQVSVAGGIGWQAVESERVTLKLEIGVGLRRNRLQDDTVDDENVLRPAAELVWRISPNSTFTENITSEIGDELALSTVESALKVVINHRVALKLTHKLRHNSKPPAGRVKTDHETAVTLVYSF